jgi:diguanylate cyclase
VLGWESGFHYYVLLMVPMVFVSPSRTLHVKMALGVALALFYAGIDYLGHHHAALTPISPAGMAAVRYFNIATSLALLAYLAHFYLGAVLSAERRLQTLATTDALTDLANRRRALDVAAQQLGRRRRDGTPLSLILGDVDHFKSINDRFGHDVGDRVLVEVAQALRRATREYDTVCRWGGEEFLVVLPETALSAALQVAERAREAVQQARVSHNGHVLVATITLGVSTLRDGESLEDAIARADAAMYRGKVGGRNRCVGEDLAQPMRREETLRD